MDGWSRVTGDATAATPPLHAVPHTGPVQGTKEYRKKRLYRLHVTAH